MPRSQNKVASHRRRKRILKEAKGYWGARSKVLTVAKHSVDKGYQFAYRDRKAKKRFPQDFTIKLVKKTTDAK